MRELLRNGNLTRLIELAALGVEKKKKAPKPKTTQQIFSGMEFPDWWPASEWEQYLLMRKRKRAPMTDLATKMLVKQVMDLRTAGHDPSAVLAQSVFKGWTDVYAPRGDSGKTSIQPIESTNLAGWRSRLEIFYIGDDSLPKGAWSPKWGPEPGQPGCLAPQEALARFQSHQVSQVGARRA